MTRRRTRIWCWPKRRALLSIPRRSRTARKPVQLTPQRTRQQQSALSWCLSPYSAFTMSGFAHLLSSSNWRRKLLRSIKSRVGVRGISRCTTKALHARFAKQLRQLMTRVEHSRLDGVCRDGNDLGYLFDRFDLVIDEIHHFTMSRDEHHCSPPSEFVLMNRETTVAQFTMKCSAHHNDWTY